MNVSKLTIHCGSSRRRYGSVVALEQCEQGFTLTRFSQNIQRRVSSLLYVPLNSYILTTLLYFSIIDLISYKFSYFYENYNE